MPRNQTGAAKFEVVLVRDHPGPRSAPAI